MTVYLTKWTPFRVAARLHSLRQGTLNVGNTLQNIANLKTLAIANALSSASWARYIVGFGPLSAGGCLSSTAGLVLNVPYVPGYVPPPGTGTAGVAGAYVLGETGNVVTDESGNRVLQG